MSVEEEFPKKIFPAVPLLPADPDQPVMVSVVLPVQLTAEELENVSLQNPP